jgi:hypothetical protein
MIMTRGALDERRDAMAMKKGDVSRNFLKTLTRRETTPSGDVVVGPAQNWAGFHQAS